MLFLVAYYGLFASVMGGMAVALDTTAGERERQSLEPLLMTPARPGELVVGKWLAVAAFNALVVLITLTGFYLTLWFAPLPAVGVPFLFGAREFARFLVVLVPLIAAAAGGAAVHGQRAAARSRKRRPTSRCCSSSCRIIPVVQLFQQQKDPDWIVLVPVSGQYSLLGQVLRGESIPLAAARDCRSPCPLALTVVVLLSSRASCRASRSSPASSALVAESRRAANQIPEDARRARRPPR